MKSHALIGTPVKILGLFNIVLGLAILALFHLYYFIYAVVFLSSGLLLYLIDFSINRLIRREVSFWVFQFILTVLYLVFAYWFFVEYFLH